MLWRVLVGFLAIIAVSFGAFYAWAWKGEIPPASPSASSFDPGIVAKGAQLAALGGCAVCHTQAGGRPFAGGLPVETPFGTVYGTNITPDPTTGIGNWSEAAFRRALREGVDRKGEHLYPAFPYDHFTRTTDGDISALYAFLMTREPVQQQNRAPDLAWPLNNRLFAAAWKLLFLHRGPERPDTSQSPQWNRGAYLVASLGHCGACHTPRNALGAEKRGDRFAGGASEGWHAPALNAASPAPVPWSAAQLYYYLRTGFADQHGRVAGPMQPVVQSLGTVSDADLHAIATYFASLAAPQTAAQREQRTKAALDFAHERAVKVSALSPGASTTGTLANSETAPASRANAGSNGATIFAGACASCHHSGGQLPISRPVALGLSTPVNAPDPTDLIRLILDGIHPPPGARGPIMPGFSGAFTDPQIAALVTYVRSQYSRRPAWTDVAGTLTKLRKKQSPAREAP